MFFCIASHSPSFDQADPYSRHRRTHEARPDGELDNYSDEDLEAEENEFGALDEELSPPPEHHHNYMQSAMTNMSAASMRMPTTGMGVSHGMGPPPMMSSQHLLQQQM